MNKVLFVLLIGIASLAFGKDFYISLSGSDQNSGSRKQPWKSLQKSIWRMKSGDTLIIRGGTYHEAAYGDFEIPLDRKWTTIRSEKNETVIFDGRVPVGEALRPSWTKAGVDCWTTQSTGKWKWLDGLWVDGLYYPKVDKKKDLKEQEWFHPKKSDEVIVCFASGKNPKNSKLELRLEAMITFDSPYWIVDGIKAEYFNQYGIGAWKTHHVTIKNCEANHNGGAGIATDHATHLIIADNKTAYNGAEGGPGWASGIHVLGTLSPDNIVSGNISHHNWDPSFHHTDGNGFSIDKGHTNGGAEVFNNIAYSNGGRGLDIMETAHVKLHDNTFFNDSLDPHMNDQGEISIYGNESTQGLSIEDNILLATKKDPPLTVWRGVTPSDVNSDYNILYNSDNPDLAVALRGGKIRNLNLTEWVSLSHHDQHSYSLGAK